MRVNMEWRRFVEHRMACGDFQYFIKSRNDASSFQHFLNSPLRRHVKYLVLSMGHSGKSAEFSTSLSVQLPHLHSLDIPLQGDSVHFQFAARLQVLQVGLVEFRNVSALEAVIRTISELPHLHTLTLLLPGENEDADTQRCRRDASFASLAHMVPLTNLTISKVLMTPAHIQEFRALHQLETLTLFNTPCSASDLFAKPHQLRLQQLCSQCDIIRDNHDAAALSNLAATLSHLRLYAVSLRHADFLYYLDALHTLSLEFLVVPGPLLQSSRIMHAIQSRTQLTSLSLSGRGGFDFTSDQLAGCLIHLPSLKYLSLSHCKSLTSLSFLSVGTLSTTLATLKLSHLENMSIMELLKVHGLDALSYLSLDSHTFAEPLDAFTRRLYAPPSRLIPSLRNFLCA